MMNTSFSEEAGDTFSVPVTTFLYRDMKHPHAPPYAHDSPYEKIHTEPDEAASEGPSAQQISDLVNSARAEAIMETEQRLKAAYEAKLEIEAGKVRRALERFADEQKEYFFRVESEVVQLALAIAAKILHRHAQVDPLLVAALVRVAVDKLHDGSSVSVRVAPKEAGKWRQHLANPLNGSTIQIVEDAHLGEEDCILETDLGSANFSLDAQLKEVEQGFFDLLAQRPVAR